MNSSPKKMGGREGKLSQDMEGKITERNKKRCFLEFKHLQSSDYLSFSEQKQNIFSENKRQVVKCQLLLTWRCWLRV